MGKRKSEVRKEMKVTRVRCNYDEAVVVSVGENGDEDFKLVIKTSKEKKEIKKTKQNYALYSVLVNGGTFKRLRGCEFSQKMTGYKIL